MSDSILHNNTELTSEERLSSFSPSKSHPLRKNVSDPFNDFEFQVQCAAINLLNVSIPVSICIAIVVATMNSVDYYNDSELRDLIYKELISASPDSNQWMSLAAGFAVMSFSAIVTTVIVLLVKDRCSKFLHGWTMCSTFGCLFFFTAAYVRVLLSAFDFAPSSPTIWFCIYNSAAVGIMSTHWIGPLKVQQFYLILISAQAALVSIKLLNDTAVWSMLAVISFIWDPIAVMCPRGPLRVLFETSREMNEPIPSSMVYTSEAYQIIYADKDSGYVQPPHLSSHLKSENEGKSSSKLEFKHFLVETSQQSTESAPLAQNVRKRQVKAFSPNNGDSNNIKNIEKSEQDTKRRQDRGGSHLGLGDFVFYTILVGKVSTYGDWNTTLACYLGIAVGLGLTFALLFAFKCVLPALPFSVFGGMLLYISSCFCIAPYIAEITDLQVLY